MKNIRLTATAVCAAAMLAFTQCQPSPQPTVITQYMCDSIHALKVAYVDIDTLLINYNLWVDLNEEMLSKEENIRITLNEKAQALQAELEDFESKLNSNAFATRERAESEQNRLLQKRQDLEELQERLTTELMAENEKNNLLFRDSINSFVREYNKLHGYNIILSRMGDNILYIDGCMNITQQIIDGLNARYKKN